MYTECHAAEVILYALLNFVVYIPGMLYPFRGHFRFNKTISSVVVAIAVVFETMNHLAVYRGFSPTLSTLVTTGISLAIVLILLKENFGKIFMTLMIVQNVAILILQLAKYTESIFFYQNALENGRWSLSLFLALWQLPFMAMYFFFMRKFYIPAVSRSHNPDIWNYLWMIPMTFYLIWESYISSFPNFVELPLSMRTSIMLMLLLINGGSFLIYYIVTLLLAEQTKTENYALQYKALNGRIMDARRARHDVRHHLVMIQSYLEDGKYDELKDYVNHYRGSLPMEESLTYCDHYASNALLTYFVQRAKEAGIHYAVRVSFPDEMPLTNDELTVVLGNLLENALDACTEGKEKDPAFNPQITVTGSYESGSLMFCVKNTTIRDAVKDRNDNYISTKHEGLGIGIDSVRGIVHKHHGVLNIEQQNHTFKATVLMM